MPSIFRVRCLLAALLMVIAMGPVRATSANDDIDAIRAAVFDYFEGINEVDRERIERAFDGSASLKSVAEDGGIRVESIAEARNRWLKAEPQPRTGVILSLDVSDGKVARVVFDFDGAYLDFLTLLKIDGQWKIIDKVFIRTR